MININIVQLKRYIAEAFGTFMLALIILLASRSNAAAFTPFLAAIVVGFIVYSIGSISGAHINPAVTLGLLSVKKITPKESLAYIIAQFVGAVLAFGLASYFLAMKLPIAPSMAGVSLKIFAAETIGTIIFAFGIASVVYEKPHTSMHGMVIGTALLLGSIIASFGGAFGILNPAAALTAGTLNIVYGLAPIVGAVIGMNFYKFLAK